jgi:hypothetical protein
LDRGLGVKTFPLSDLILLPLAPTIVGTIADFLQLMAQELYVNSSNNCDNFITEFQQDFAWGEYLGQNGTSKIRFARSIRLVPTSQYQYVSTIAHRLAAKSIFTPVEICQQLHLPMPTSAIDIDDRLEVYCWYNDAGYIYFQFTPESIAKWLNYIHDLPLDIQLRAKDRACLPVNIALYAHARCCSLLKLADTEKIVAITDNWQIAPPDWLRNECSCVENHLKPVLAIIFEERAEERLIHALMEVLDGIYSYSSQLGSAQKLAVNAAEVPPSFAEIRQNSPNWTKLALDLAESWLEFHRHCRIFGDVQRQNPRLAIARCGLTAISRRYLQVLLENYLGVKSSIFL